MSPTRIKVEKLEGFAGFGGTSHLRSEGEIDLDQLPAGDRAVLERLLTIDKVPPVEPLTSDSFRYRLSWSSDGNEKCVEVYGNELPESVKAVAQDRLV